MSQQLISRSPDLGRLRADGYDIEVQSGFLMVRAVPYLDAGKGIVFGTLVKALTLSGDVADYQGDHTIFLAGPTPHDADGSPLQRVINATAQQEPLPGVVVDHVLSNKPTAGYVDYYELITTYVAVLSKHARTVDETVTAQTFPAVRPDTEEGSPPFLYVDTASSRVGITAINAKVEVTASRSSASAARVPTSWTWSPSLRWPSFTSTTVTGSCSTTRSAIPGGRSRWRWSLPSR